MGIISAAAKIGAKKDLAKESLSSTVAAAKDKVSDIKTKIVTIKEDPKTYFADKYSTAKAKALDDARVSKSSASSSTSGEDKEREKLEKKEEKLADERLKQLRNDGKAIGGRGSGDSGSDNGHLTILFWIALLTHFVDAMTKFQRPGFMVFVYLGMMIYAVIVVYKMGRPDIEEMEFFGFIVLAYFLPFLPNFFPDNRWILAISGVIFLFPLLPLYLGIRFPENSSINKWSKRYFVLWAIILVFYLIVTFAPDQNTKTLIKDPMAGVKYVLSGVGGTFEKTYKTFDTSIKRAIAQATGQPYEGQEESQVGIYITDVKPLESKYNTNSEVYVEAKVSAKNVKQAVPIISLFCYIPDVKSGNVSPSQLPNMRENDENIVDCNLGKLKEGSYDVKVKANFQFETTSDIEYTFVSQGVRTDQYKALGIDEKTIATYTGGPVELGLPSLQQPLRILIDESNKNVQLSSYPFGVSLKNKWPQGKVVRGIRYILDVPDEVKLVGCSRNPVYVRNTTDGSTYRNIYSFNINTANAQDVFDAVSCRMQFDDVTKLLGNDLKSVKTFAARAVYEYSIEESTLVVVEKNQ